MSLIYGAPVPKVRWINSTTWSCDRHIPPAKIPHTVDSCWYWGCSSLRPPLVVEEAPEPAPKPKLNKKVRVLTKQQLPELPESSIYVLGEPEFIGAYKPEFVGYTGTENETLNELLIAERAAELLEAELAEESAIEVPQPVVLSRAEKEKEARALAKEKKDWELISKYLTPAPPVAQEPIPEPPQEVLDLDQPSQAERRRGAVQKVLCGVCGKTSWKRPKEVVIGKTYYCADHRYGAKATIEPEPELIPEPPVPTEADIRQGRTKMTHCSTCGVVLWRKKTDLAKGKLFFCPDHRRGGKPR